MRLSPRHVWSVFVARNREFVRDRSALVWTLGFPFVLVFGFAFAFSDGTPDRHTVGVLVESGTEAVEPVTGLDHVDHIAVHDLDAALDRVQRHRLHMLVDPASGRYWVSDDSPTGYLLERALHGTGVDNPDWQRETVPGEVIRYVDWLLPGLLGMNMMFTALFGVGFVIVRYRKNGVLRRLSATPLTAFEFLCGQLGSRLVILLATTTILFLGSHLLLGIPVHGSYLALLVIYALGAVCLIALGLTIAARTASEELAGGLLNLLTWPMMILSGVWFSTESLHPWLQQVAAVLPLTHLIDAARAVMLDGVGLLAVSHHLLVLIATAGVFLALGARLFRWD